MIPYAKLSRVSLPLGLALLLFVVTAQAAVSFTPAAPPNAQSAAPTMVTKTIVLMPVKDNTLYESATGDLSSGAGPNFFSGRTLQGDGSNLRRAVMMFDVSNQIPNDAQILTATLSLRVSMARDSISYDHSLHRLESDWGEGESVANSGGGVGGSATSGDATWLHTFYDTELWMNPGGDFASTPTAVTGVGGSGSFYDWSSPDLVTDLQNWLDETSPNYGWILLGDESTGGSAKRFDSRENNTEGNRPQLTITYQFTPTVPTDAVLAGDSEGLINTSYTFTASVVPTTTTIPITYTWTANEQPPIVLANTNSLENVVSYSWATSGTKTITVTADNNFGIVTQTHSIQIDPPTAPENVILVGAEEGIVNTSYTFTASVMPMTTTVPITYTWMADDQAPTIITDSQNLQDAITYSWATSGTKTITVTADNNFGTVTQTHVINLAEPTPEPVGVATVTVSGPVTGSLNTSYDFTLTVGPVSATLPITYTVQATEQTELSFSTGLTQSIRYEWSTSGMKTITVTADNGYSSAMNTWTITIEDEPVTEWLIYLPLLTR